MNSDIKVIHNTDRSRFEVELDGQLARLDYEMRDGDLALLHTEVPSVFQGRGIAGQLAKAALEHARYEKLLIRPFCPFVQTYLKRHTEYQDLVKGF
jgi:predicted GNAT family acetyltransferase